MNPHYGDDRCELHLGDCRDILPLLPDNSADAVVCDPPYEIGFMGRGWDASGIAYDTAMWRQVWRVLKPGGHLLAFGATRTYHRLAVAIEDAGFEIRDSIHWIYGNGFPKGQDIGKHIDRKRDDRTDVLRVTAFLRDARIAAGISVKAIDEAFGFNGMASHWTATANKAATVPTFEQWTRLRQILGFDSPEMDELVAGLNGRKGLIGEAWNAREIVGYRHSGLDNGGGSVFLSGTVGRDENGMLPVTTAATDAAKQWQGWNTQLKPAHEPIVVARKSTGFNTTVANVLEHGTGALNIDACRITADQDYYAKCASVVGLNSNRNGATPGTWTGTREDSSHEAGRWPTNIVFTHSPACDQTCAAGCPVADLGENARFFPAFRYEAKAPASQRPRLDDGTEHATVKPLALMSWLVRLVTPVGGVVLDPFAGSGTTLEACTVEGFRAIGIEKESAYAELCVKRLSKSIQPTLGFETT